MNLVGCSKQYKDTLQGTKLGACFAHFPLGFDDLGSLFVSGTSADRSTPGQSCTAGNDVDADDAVTKTFEPLKFHESLV